MKTMRRHPRRAERGLTTVDLAVVLVTGTLITFAVVALVAAHEQTVEAMKAKITAMQLMQVEAAVQDFHDAAGFYPAQVVGFVPLLHALGGRAPLLERMPRDRWGHPLGYFIPPLRDDAVFEIRSAGPDGVLGNADDMSRLHRERPATGEE